MGNFRLDYGENFEKVCGEIILTSNGRLAFYCTLCGKYKRYETFIPHLLKSCLQSLDDDLREFVTETNLSINSTEVTCNLSRTKFLSVLDPTITLSHNLSMKPIKNGGELKILKQTNAILPKTLEIEISNKINEEEFTSHSLETENFENFQESMLSEPTSRTSPFLEIDPKGDSSSHMGNVVFSEEFPGNEYCDDNYDEFENVEHLESVEIEENVHFLTEKSQQYQDEICTKSRKRNQNVLENETETKEITQVEVPGIVVRNVRVRGKYFPSKIADEERKYKCPVCAFAFKDLCNMKHHLKRHTNQKKYSCSVCEMKFFTTTELRSHSRKHMEKREKPFLCTECGLSFETNYRLVNHQKRHLNQRDYICEVCQKAFYESANLRDHMACHSSERPYSCNVCQASFKRPHILQAHMKQHENKRKYKCMLCEAAFNVQAGLYSHMKSKHKNVSTFNK